MVCNYFLFTKYRGETYFFFFFFLFCCFIKDLLKNIETSSFDQHQVKWIIKRVWTALSFMGSRRSNTYTHTHINADRTLLHTHMVYVDQIPRFDAYEITKHFFVINNFFPSAYGWPFSFSFSVLFFPVRVLASPALHPVTFGLKQTNKKWHFSQWSLAIYCFIDSTDFVRPHFSFVHSLSVCSLIMMVGMLIFQLRKWGLHTIHNRWHTHTHSQISKNRGEKLKCIYPKYRPVLP